MKKRRDGKHTSSLTSTLKMQDFILPNPNHPQPCLRIHSVMMLIRCNVIFQMVSSPPAFMEPQNLPPRIQIWYITAQDCSSFPPKQIWVPLNPLKTATVGQNEYVSVALLSGQHSEYPIQCGNWSFWRPESDMVMLHKQKVKVYFQLNWIVKVYTAWVVLPFPNQTSVWAHAWGFSSLRKLRYGVVRDIAKHMVLPESWWYILISH